MKHFKTHQEEAENLKAPVCGMNLAPNDEPFYPEGFPDKFFKHSGGK